jgi:hypothetical protein
VTLLPINFEGSFGPSLLHYDSPSDGADHWYPLLLFCWHEIHRRPETSWWTIAEEQGLVGVENTALSLLELITPEKMSHLPRVLYQYFSDFAQFYQAFRPLLAPVRPDLAYKTLVFKKILSDIERSPKEKRWWFLAAQDIPPLIQQRCLKLLEAPVAERIVFIHASVTPRQAASFFLPTMLSRLKEQRLVAVPSLSPGRPQEEGQGVSFAPSFESQIENLWKQKKGQWDYRYNAYFLDFLHSLGHHKELSTKPIALQAFMQQQLAKTK